jgi:hypothetical protein
MPMSLPVSVSPKYPCPCLCLPVRLSLSLVHVHCPLSQVPCSLSPVPFPVSCPLSRVHVGILPWLFQRTSFVTDNFQCLFIGQKSTDNFLGCFVNNRQLLAFITPRMDGNRELTVVILTYSTDQNKGSYFTKISCPARLNSIVLVPVFLSEFCVVFCSECSGIPQSFAHAIRGIKS